MGKSIEAAKTLLEKMASNNCYNKPPQRKVVVDMRLMIWHS